MIIVKEGLWIIVPCTLLPILLMWLTAQPWWALIFIFTGLMFFFFRDPNRAPPSGSNLVLSPADGRINAIIQESNGLLFFVELGIINSHLQRIPMSGTVTKITKISGKHRILNFMSPKLNFNNQSSLAKIENASNTFEFELENSKKMWLTQIVGMLARRLKSFVQVGSKLQAGEKIGLIYFGSMVKVKIEGNFEVKVKKGSKVKAGETIVAIQKES